MKKRILILENNAQRLITLKSLFAAKFNVHATEKAFVHAEDAIAYSKEFAPDTIILGPSISMLNMVEKMKRRKISRLNTEVLIVNHDTVLRAAS